MSEDEQRQILNRLTLNKTSLFRTAVAKYLSGEQQDLDTALGYPTEIRLEDYDLLYERGDIASRIVNIYPDECWRAIPEVYDSEDADDTPFQKAWRDLLDNNDLKVLYWLHRLDRLSGVGHYGILVMGFKDDDGNYHEPASGTKEITYFRVFKETQVEIPTWIEDPASPKYGWPDIYKVHMKTPKGTIVTQRIHHTRILHVAEDSNDNMVHGTPRLKTVYNRLLDLRKLRGGSAEMFWQGAFPGTMFSLDPEAEVAPGEEEKMEEQFERYIRGLDRYMRLRGVTPHQMSPQVADPKSHIEVQQDAIAAAKEIPKRILFGSEQAQLASAQDRRNWQDRVQGRRNRHCTPIIIKPFVQRLIDFGVLPQPQGGTFQVDWPEEGALTQTEDAEVKGKQTETLTKYANSAGAQMILPPNQFLIRFLNMEQDEVDAILGDLEDFLDKEDASANEPPPNAGEEDDEE